MTTELQPPTRSRTTGYGVLGAHRHLVVSERLQLRRHELGLTQKQVVSRLRRLGVATTNKALSSLEHGAGLDVCKLPELAVALECTLTYVVGLTDDPGAWEPDPGSWPSASVRPVALASAHRDTPRVVGPPVPPVRLAPPPPVAPVEPGAGPNGPWILGPIP